MNIRSILNLLKETDSSIFGDFSTGSIIVPDMLNNGDNYNPGDNRLAKTVMPIQRRKLKNNSLEDEETINNFKFIKHFSKEQCIEVFKTLTKKEQNWTCHFDSYKNFPMGQYCFGFKDGKKPIAFVQGRVLSDKTIVYTLVAVDKKYRGNGLASKLLEELISAVKKDGYKTLVYRVDRNNEASQKVIKNAGGKYKSTKDNFRRYEIKLN